MDERTMKEARQRAAWRPRRIIFNNDGGDARRGTGPWDHPGDFIHRRTTPLLGTQVDSISYCTTAGTFGRFYHNSQVAEVAGDTRGRYQYSAIPGLLELGTDPLEETATFCRDNGLEVLWSLRMNDTHDAGNPLLFSQLKAEHPEWLFGSHEDQPQHGKWSSIDYGRDEVRDLVLTYVADVVNRYPIDGVELDFFRHPVFFAKQGRGGTLAQSDIDAMTGVVESVRRLLDEKSSARPQQMPLLLAVLVPDSLEYCLRVGLDVATWLESGYVDVLETTGYFRLSPWQYSVELGHRFDVPVYGCLAEHRIRDREAKEARAQLDVYRARAMQIWGAGADGISLFNYFDAASPLFREIGDPGQLSRLDKTYYASVRGRGKPAGNLVPWHDLITVPTLSPDDPVRLEDGSEYVTTITVGEDISAIAAEGNQAMAALELRVTNHDSAAGLQVTLNSVGLGESQPQGEWLSWAIDPTALTTGAVVPGENRLRIGATGSGSGESPLLLDARLVIQYRD